MYAVVDIAGQQFKVEAGNEIFVQRLPQAKGESVAANLEPGEIYRYSSADKVKDGDRLKIFGDEYIVKKSIEKSGLEEFFDASMSLFGKEVIIVANTDEKEALIAKDFGSDSKEDQYYIGFNVSSDTSIEQIQTVNDTLRGRFDNLVFRYKEEERV